MGQALEEIMVDSVESTELMDEQLAAAKRKAQRLAQNLKRARDLHHFSKSSKTNLLKAFEEVRSLNCAPCYSMADYLVAMVCAHERKLLNQDIIDLSVLKLSGDPFARAAVEPALIEECLYYSAPEHDESLEWNFVKGRFLELQEQPLLAWWYYMEAVDERCEGCHDDYLSQIKTSYQRITKQLTQDAHCTRTAQRNELQARVQDLTRRFTRYSTGPVPLVDAHQKLVQDLLAWYLPGVKLSPTPFPSKDWGLRGALDPSIKGPVPEGFWLNEQGCIEFEVQSASTLERKLIDELCATALYQNHALFHATVTAPTQPELSALHLTAWLKEKHPKLSVPRLDCFSHTQWSNHCALAALFLALPLNVLQDYFYALRIPYEVLNNAVTYNARYLSNNACCFSIPFMELTAAARLGLQLVTIRVNAHDFARPDGAPRSTGSYGKSSFYRWVTDLSEQLNPSSELLGYSLGDEYYYLDLVVYDSAALETSLKQLPPKLKHSDLSSAPLFAPKVMTLDSCPIFRPYL